MNKSTTIAIFLATVLSLASCSSSAPMTNVNVPFGVIKTEGVTIRDVNNRFVLESGVSWTPPFQNSTHGFGLHKAGASIAQLSDLAITKMGAKRVRVKVPYMEQELYGVLLLSKVYDGCTSAVTRSYQISIPESYVEKALDGRISVLYEYYSDCETLRFYNANAKTWVLWLSDIPF